MSEVISMLDSLSEVFKSKDSQRPYFALANKNGATLAYNIQIQPTAISKKDIAMCIVVRFIEVLKVDMTQEFNFGFRTKASYVSQTSNDEFECALLDKTVFTICGYPCTQPMFVARFNEQNCAEQIVNLLAEKIEKEGGSLLGDKSLIKAYLDEVLAPLESEDKIVFKML